MNTDAHNTTFDLIILYNSIEAISAANSSYVYDTPFPPTKKYRSYNNTYAYFLKQCAQYGLHAAFATTDDIDGEGSLRAVWVYKQKKWIRQIKQSKTKFIFDKFSVSARENTDAYDLLNVQGGEVKLFHNRTARALFNNKWSTYKEFPEYAIPTTKVGLPTEKNVRKARRRLRMKLALAPGVQFKQQFVMKDQFGAGGKHIYKLRADEIPEMQDEASKEIPFIMQPRINANGFAFDAHQHGSIDLRVIVVDGKIIQSYIRIAQNHEFRANASLGAEVVYIHPQEVPDSVVTAVENIDSHMPTGTNFYALDFIKNPSGELFLVEGNITPGIIWFNEEDEWYVKKLIRLIVKNIQQRIKK